MMFKKMLSISAPVAAVPDFGRKYQVLEHLATGGMAEIYLAKMNFSSGVSKTVVLKKIMKDYERDKRWTASFLNEAKILSELTHSNIVQIHDFGKARSGYYVAMEYMDGGSVLDTLSQATTLPKSHALYIGVEIVKGLSYSHAQGILHRDLSPSNILLSREGEVKLADFGVAKLLSKSLEPTQALKGKESYMSPEQRLARPLSPSSDLYALSVILYELITGVPYTVGAPFSKETLFLSKGLAQNPNDRISDCERYENLLRSESKKSGMSSAREMSQFIRRVVPDKKESTLLLHRDWQHKKSRRSNVKRRVAIAVLLLATLAFGLKAPAFSPHGFLSLNVKPWGEVYIHNKLIGITPILKRPLPIGLHDLRVKNQLLKSTRKIRVHIKPYEVTTVSLSVDG